MRPFRPAIKVFIPLFVVFVALMSGWMSRREQHPTESDRVGRGPDRGTRAPFDFYLLALTAHPAFCADGHSRKSECHAKPAIPISIHGLWPERLAAGKYPRDCQGPPLDLSPSLQTQVAALMPGMSDGLHEHEWRTHGTCTGLDDDAYFTGMYVFASHVNDALRDELTSLSGRKTTANDLRRHADNYRDGMGATLTFHCRTLSGAPPEHRHEPYLIEIRQCLDDKGPEGAPGSPVDCSRYQRRDQGCGSSFRIMKPP